MAYRHDPDLEFLRSCSSDDLDILVQMLTKDKDGTIRLTEELTGTDQYKRYSPDHKRYWDLIAAELQCFGGNTFATIFRGGKGVSYKEVLTDVCDKMKVNYNEKASVETIEMNLLMKILTDSMADMTPAQLRDVVKDLDLKTTDMTKQGVIAAIQGGVVMSGFMAYKIAAIVANAVAKFLIGRGLTLAGNQVLMRTIGTFAGPIGWALTALWTAFDISGPAYRVTMPCVVQVAFLRAKTKYGSTSR
ncbi:DUF3944 domain-containing protein [Azohydromonas aeria]|uniref:DUF3944 domain-containing protein n=1 Tax=Azohydromonas aeria TaxID=2590212 RepID=UPI0012FC3ED9|nr:DUF3944 domain-containing protein [Azohydromonas aeria]